MKTIIVCLLLFFPPMLCQLRAEIITVNFQKVFEEYRILKVQDQKLREQVAVFQQDQQQKVQDLQAEQQSFTQMRNQAAQPGTTDEVRKELVGKATKALEELNRKEQELRQERADFQKDMEAKASRLRRSIVDTVNEKISEMAKENGWDVVLDSSAKSPNGLSVVPYVAESTDKTDLLIQILNSTAAESVDSEE